MFITATTITRLFILKRSVILLYPHFVFRIIVPLSQIIFPVLCSSKPPQLRFPRKPSSLFIPFCLFHVRTYIPSHNNGNKVKLFCHSGSSLGKMVEEKFLEFSPTSYPPPLSPSPQCTQKQIHNHHHLLMIINLLLFFSSGIILTIFHHISIHLLV